MKIKTQTWRPRMTGDCSTLAKELLLDQFGKLVPRKEVHSVLGVYTRGYLANLDHQNKGIGGRIRIGGKIFYPRDEVLKFISERMSLEG